MKDALMDMYVEGLAKTKLPIVFKGAYVLNHILRTSLTNPIERGTVDIDVDKSMEEHLMIW